jgi:HEAT repeat protein
MNDFITMLKGGSLISDGRADDVAAAVLDDPQRMDALIDALLDRDDVVRGRAAHAVEKVLREKPSLAAAHFPLLRSLAFEDPVPMVKWHIAMVLGTISDNTDLIDGSLDVLFHLLSSSEEGVFVKSWAIVSLSIIDKRYSDRRDLIVAEFRKMESDRRASIRSKIRKALSALTEPGRPLPKGWDKREG